MEKIYLNIAGFNILCEIPVSEKQYHRGKFLEMVKKDYPGFIVRSKKKPDFTISVGYHGAVPIDIKKGDSKRKDFFIGSFHIHEKKRLVHVNNPLGSFEFEFLIGYILNTYLIPKVGFILHGSSVAYKNKSFLFEGKEGAGKSTTAQLLKGLCNVLSDDSIIIRNIDKKWYLYQPFLNEKNYNFKKYSKSYLPWKVFFIKKADKCAIEEIKNKDIILSKMLKQLFTFEEKIKIQFSLIAEFVNRTDFYYLYVKKDEKIFKEFFKKEILKI